MTLPTPFADDSSTASLGGLTVENGRHRLTLYGTLEITRDKPGLAAAQALAAFLNGAIATMQADAQLPDKVAPPAKPGTMRNPFA